jgi:hypothetical protein
MRGRVTSPVRLGAALATAALIACSSSSTSSMPSCQWSGTYTLTWLSNGPGVSGMTCEGASAAVIQVPADADATAAFPVTTSGVPYATSCEDQGHSTSASGCPGTWSGYCQTTLSAGMTINLSVDSNQNVTGTADMPGYACTWKIRGTLSD